MPLKNRFSFQEGGRLIASVAFCESQKTVTGISLVLVVSFNAISKARAMSSEGRQDDLTCQKERVTMAQ